MKISTRAQSVAESQTLAVDAKVGTLRSQGKDIVNLSAGQPDFDSPTHVLEAAHRAMLEGQTRYTPAAGTPALRGAVADFFTQRWNVTSTAEECIVCCGAKHALYGAFLATLDPGDEVLVPVPYWVSYPEQIKLAQGVPVPVSPSQGLLVTTDDLDQCRTPKTKALIFNNPSNPTGCLYNPDQVEAITAWCVEQGVTLVSDEIYNDLVYDGLHALSPGSLGTEARQSVITINGVSKSYAMTGWRIGFVTAPQPVIKAMTKIQSQTTGNPSSISQAAALAALTGPQEELGLRRAVFEKRRDRTQERLAQMPGVHLDHPQGAFYAFPAMEQAVQHVGGSIALAEHLVDQGVACVPGIAFGADAHMRVSFALDDSLLDEGLNRLETALRSILPIASH